MVDGMNGIRAFTLVEVLATLLVLTVGMAAAIALITRTINQAADSRNGSLALPTALSVLEDPTPLLGDPLQADWTLAPSEASGSINGFWVTRRERSVASTNGLAFVDVTVEVTSPSSPQPVMRLRSRLLRGGP
jgi:prepilin-type N-terminal cleavage/methylation domain-containing protein